MKVYYQLGVAIHLLLLEEKFLLSEFANVALQTGLFGASSVNNILNIVFVISFLGFMVFGQQIQSRIALMQIDGAVRRLENMRNDAQSLTLKMIKEVGKSKDDPSPKLNSLLEQFLISPVDMDPAGIVKKFDHLLHLRLTISRISWKQLGR